jgi:membrane protein
MLSVAASSAMSVASGFLPEAWWGGLVIRAADALLSVAVLILLFGSAYRILPDMDVGWRQVWPGSVAVTSVYGAGGTFAAVLVWIYYSAHIFYFSAELNCVLRPSPGY